MAVPADRVRIVAADNAENPRGRIMQSRVLPFAATAAIAALSIHLLAVGRNIFIPIAIAVMGWYLINAIARGFGRLSVRGVRPPRWAAPLLTAIVVAAAVIGLAELVGGSFAGVADAMPVYQANLQRLIGEASGLLGLDSTPSVAQLVERIDFRAAVGKMAAGLTGLAGDAGLILIYMLFLFVDQGSFERKMKALFPDREREAQVRRMLGQMTREIQNYLWIKTTMSLLTGALSYAVLYAVGVDFAAFWAVIVFLLNYIPTIGSLLGVVFPALLALVQFDSFVPFLIVTPCLVIVQVLVGNVLEPMAMGSSLNISPFTTLVSLAVWGALWGIPGMFLCVPITVIAMIVLAHFPRTRPVAIALSSTGRVTWGESRPPAREGG